MGFAKYMEDNTEIWVENNRYKNPLARANAFSAFALTSGSRRIL